MNADDNHNSIVINDTIIIAITEETLVCTRVQSSSADVTCRSRHVTCEPVCSAYARAQHKHGHA